MALLPIHDGLALANARIQKLMTADSLGAAQAEISRVMAAPSGPASAAVNSGALMAKAVAGSNSGQSVGGPNASGVSTVANSAFVHTPPAQVGGALDGHPS